MNRKTLFLIIFLSAMALMLNGCLEDLFGPDDEEPIDSTDVTDDSFVGKWCRVTVSVDGAMSTNGAILTINDDGTGTHSSSDGDDPFAWKTEDSILTVTLSEDKSFTASYLFGTNTMTLSYEEDGKTIVEKYAKYTGDRDANLIGKWVGVRSTMDGVDQVPAMTVTMNSDGAATAFFMDSTNIGSQAFSWTTSGKYLLNDLLTEDSDMWTGIEYTLAAPLMSVKEYYDEGQVILSTFIKDTGEKDVNLTGTWNLTALVVNNISIPSQYIPQGWSFTLDAPSGAGSLALDATTVTYSWTTNSGYLLLYPTLASQQIGIGQQYAINGNTLSFSIVFNEKTVGYLFGSSQYLAAYASAANYVVATFTFTKQ